jgi:hypothetical protein
MNDENINTWFKKWVSYEQVTLSILTNHCGGLALNFVDHTS